MKSVLITGSSGYIGQKVLSLLEGSAVTAVQISRRPSPGVRGVDLLQGGGLDSITPLPSTILHLASNPLSPQEDMGATANLVETAKRTGVEHLIYLSIVGVHRASLPYYQAKLECEKIIERSGIPFSIIRATQFHEFSVFLLRKMMIGPVFVFPPNGSLQPVEADAVAQHLVKIISLPPTISTENIAGPDIIKVSEMGRLLLLQNNERKLSIPLPIPITALEAVAKGFLVESKANPIGIRWRDWLERDGKKPNYYLNNR